MWLHVRPGRVSPTSHRVEVFGTFLAFGVSWAAVGELREAFGGGKGGGCRFLGDGRVRRAAAIADRLIPADAFHQDAVSVRRPGTHPAQIVVDRREDGLIGVGFGE